MTPKRILQYLLKRSIGKFLDDSSIEMDQIDIKYSESSAVITELNLNCKKINETLCLPSKMHLHQGTISQVCLKFPLSLLWSDEDSWCLSFNDINLTFHKENDLGDGDDDDNNSEAFQLSDLKDILLTLAGFSSDEVPLAVNSDSQGLMDPFYVVIAEKIIKKIKVDLFNVRIRYGNQMSIHLGQIQGSIDSSSCLNISISDLVADLMGQSKVFSCCKILAAFNDSRIALTIDSCNLVLISGLWPVPSYLFEPNESSFFSSTVAFLEEQKDYLITIDCPTINLSMPALIHGGNLILYGVQIRSSHPNSFCMNVSEYQFQKGFEDLIPFLDKKQLKIQLVHDRIDVLVGTTSRIYYDDLTRLQRSVQSSSASCSTPVSDSGFFDWNVSFSNQELTIIGQSWKCNTFKLKISNDDGMNGFSLQASEVGFSCQEFQANCSSSHEKQKVQLLCNQKCLIAPILKIVTHEIPMKVQESSSHSQFQIQSDQGKVVFNLADKCQPGY